MKRLPVQKNIISFVYLKTLNFKPKLTTHYQFGGIDGFHIATQDVNSC